MGGGCLNTGVNRGGNGAYLHSYMYMYISVTDEVKLNEQNQSIGRGPLPKQNLKQFDYSCLKFKPCGVSDAAILAQSKYKTPTCIIP